MATRARTRAGGANAPKSVAEILATLRERIANQDIPPGAKLRETDLALEFKVPRTRIREALNSLEQRRLVERIPNRGAVVSRLDYQQALQIYDLRVVLEGLAARLATENGPADRWKKELESFKGPMKALVAKGDLEPYIERYESMRRAIIEAAANPLLAETLDNIYEKTQVLIRRILILPGRAEVGRLQHVAMLQAMASGKAPEAERLRREGLGSARLHLEKFQKYLL